MVTNSFDPTEWLGWLYEKYFVNHTVLGAVVICGTVSVVAVLMTLGLYLRAVDKYKEQDSQRETSYAQKGVPVKNEASSGARILPTASPLTVTLSEPAKQQIVEELVKKYGRLHPEARGYSQPMVNWINKKLKQQNIDLFIFLKPVQKSRGIVVEGGSDVVIEDNTIEGFDEGISIHDSPGTTAKRNKIIGPKRP